MKEFEIGWWNLSISYLKQENGQNSVSSHFYASIFFLLPARKKWKTKIRHLFTSMYFFLRNLCQKKWNLYSFKQFFPPMKKYHLVNIISFNAKQINIFTLFIVSGEKKYCDFFFCCDHALSKSSLSNPCNTPR